MNNKIINDLIYFLYNECTGDDANKKLFINFIKEVLNKTSLKERTEVELWDLVWDKPIFSGWKVSIASLIAMKHREMGTFQYSIEIPHSAESIPPFRLEGIRGLKEIFPQIYHQYSHQLK